MDKKLVRTISIWLFSRDYSKVANKHACTFIFFMVFSQPACSYYPCTILFFSRILAACTFFKNYLFIFPACTFWKKFKSNFLTVITIKVMTKLTFFNVEVIFTKQFDIKVIWPLVLNLIKMYIILSAHIFRGQKIATLHVFFLMHVY